MDTRNSEWKVLKNIVTDCIQCLHIPKHSSLMGIVQCESGYQNLKHPPLESMKEELTLQLSIDGDNHLPSVPPQPPFPFSTLFGFVLRNFFLLLFYHTSVHCLLPSMSSLMQSIHFCFGGPLLLYTSTLNLETFFNTWLPRRCRGSVRNCWGLGFVSRLGPDICIIFRCFLCIKV